MGKLSEILLASGKRDAVVSACAALVDDEVSSKSGLGGLAVKGVFKLVKAVKPGIARELVDKLLDELVGKLDPIYGEYLGGDRAQSVQTFLVTHAGRVASAMLSVTDGRAARAENKTLKGAYQKLRPSGIKHVEAAVPGMARIIQQFA